MSIAVIGAGLAGLAAADRLRDSGRPVVVLEKSRGAGGRTATRRAGELRFDHGAPFLDDGERPMASLPGVGRARLRTRDGGLADEAVGTPSANAPAKQLAHGLELRTQVRVARVEPEGPRWALTDDAGAALGTFDAVIVAVPAPQAAELLESAAPQLAAQAAAVHFAPCWSVMVAWPASLGLDFAVARGEHDLDLALAQAALPGRAAGERWVLQADAALTTEHLDAAPADVAGLLLERFSFVAGRELPEPDHLTAHRWLYARPSAPLHERCLTHGTLVVAGDWCMGATAGAAVRSGVAAAQALTTAAA